MQKQKIKKDGREKSKKRSQIREVQKLLRKVQKEVRDDCGIEERKRGLVRGSEKYQKTFRIMQIIRKKWI